MYLNNWNNHWLVKYKLYHIPFWIIYHFVWWMIAIGNPKTAAQIMFFSPFTLKFCFYIVFDIGSTYFNLYFLMPKFLGKGRYSLYFSLLLLTIVCSSLCIASGYYLTAYVNHQTITGMFGEDKCFYYFFGQALTSTFAVTTLSMTIKLTKNWIQSRMHQQEIENEKLETELKFLKNQFNPHFLFNTINSIFFLIRKNPDKASTSLATFSELLRYQLYECNDWKIPIVKEINYLENYIELEKLRQSDDLKLLFSVDNNSSESLFIAPFILMPFVENAFKHVSKDKKKSDWIKIKIEIASTYIDLNISNNYTIDANSSSLITGGIGLQNVKRRLDLIYPDSHFLNITKDDNIYKVSLKIEHLDSTIQAPFSKNTSPDFVKISLC